MLGKLDFCNLTFGTSPAFSDRSDCDLSSPEPCVSGGSDGLLLPDLIISTRLTEENITYSDEHHSLYPNQLRFAAAMDNIGHGPLHVITADSWFCDDMRATPPNPFAKMVLIRPITFSKSFIGRSVMRSLLIQSGRV